MLFKNRIHIDWSEKGTLFWDKAIALIGNIQQIVEEWTSMTFIVSLKSKYVCTAQLKVIKMTLVVLLCAICIQFIIVKPYINCFHIILTAVLVIVLHKHCSSRNVYILGLHMYKMADIHFMFVLYIIYFVNIKTFKSSTHDSCVSLL